MNTYNQYDSCYIYRHIRKDTNTPFYVGKGSQGRAWNRSRRNEFIGEWVNKTKCCKDLGLKSNNISQVINGTLKQSGGFVFIEKKGTE